MLSRTLQGSPKPSDEVRIAESRNHSTAPGRSEELYCAAVCRHLSGLYGSGASMYLSRTPHSSLSTCRSVRSSQTRRTFDQLPSAATSCLTLAVTVWPSPCSNVQRFLSRSRSSSLVFQWIGTPSSSAIPSRTPCDAQ